MALKSAICAKIKDNNLVIIDEFKIEQPKCKEAVGIFNNLKVVPFKGRGHSVLLLSDKFTDIAQRALNNLPFINTNIAKQVTAYEMFSNRKVVITQKGLLDITERLKAFLTNRQKKQS